MKRIEAIINAIDDFLVKTKQEFTTPVEINKYLERIGLLNDSTDRPGLPLRKLLRAGEISHAYQIGTNWRIPLSGNKIIVNSIPKSRKSSESQPIHEKNNSHKLYSIAVLIVELIEKKYNIVPEFILEYKPEWLLSYPDSYILDKQPEICSLYKELVDNRFELKERLMLVSEKKRLQKQSYDIWIGKPFNFAIEFDEKQHFNQFRLLTFKYYKNYKLGFPINLYSKLNLNVIIKPAASGFTKLKSQDPLFPYLLEAESQDNRIRQRAFRDFLKDILPIANNYNPTIRIPYHVTNMKISDFTDKEYKNIELYITNNQLINDLNQTPSA